MPFLPRIHKANYLLLLSTLVLFLSVFVGVSLVQKQQELRTKAAGNVYYIATNGSDSNPGTLSQPWKTIAKANSTLQAGDTVLIRAGTYSEAVKPVRSGTSSSRITYSNYGSEKVTISGVSYPLDLSGRSYITVHGLEFRNVGTFLTMTNGDYNTIEYNTFADSTYWRWAGMDIDGGSTYNWFHHNSISGHGDYVDGQDLGDMIYLPIGSDYNLFEENEIFHAGHGPFPIRSSFNVVRNNYFHNEVWKKGFGNRDMETQGMEIKDRAQNLLEGNRFGFSGIPNDATFSDGIQMASPEVIVRYNAFYENSGNGLRITTFYSKQASYSHVYNNVFYHNGVNVDPNNREGNTNRAGLKFSAWAAPIVGTSVKNNIFYKNLGGTIGFSGSASPADQTILNNWESGDPLFVNEGNSGPSNPNLPDFHLKLGSPAIDAGTHLTETTSSGSGTSLKVKDSLYFSYGFGIVDADWIKIGSGQPVQIRNVDYATNTITLAEARSWSANAPVWLYKDSRGNVVFLGSAPDIGAYELGGATTPPFTTSTPTPTKNPTPTPPPGSTNTPTPTSKPTTPTPSVTVSPPPSGDNLIRNPSFELGTQDWSFNTDGSGTFTLGSPAYEGASAAKVAISIPGSNVQLYQTGISLEPNREYSLSFAARSNTGDDLSVYIHQHGSPYTNYGLSNFVVDLTSSWQTFSTTFTLTNSTPVNDARLRFWLAPFDATGDEYSIDTVSLSKTSTSTPSPTLLGDIDKDGDVDIFDYNLLVTDFGKIGQTLADIDGDGDVDIFDYNILIENFGKKV